MKKIFICFYSYRPRLYVGLTWTTNLIPSVGDEITIENKFMSQWDRKYFSKWARNHQRTFRVKKRIWQLNEKNDFLNTYDVKLELDWTNEEKKEVENYLDNYKKERDKKKKIK